MNILDRIMVDDQVAKDVGDVLVSTLNLQTPMHYTAYGKKTARGLARCVAAILANYEMADEDDFLDPMHIRGEMVMKTQLQIFYEEQRKIGERDRFMMDLIRDNDLTNQQLERLIKHQPDRYGRYEGFIGKLPDEVAA